MRRKQKKKTTLDYIFWGMLWVLGILFFLTILYLIINWGIISFYNPNW